MSDFVLKAENLKKHYEVKRLFRTIGKIRALDGVSFSLKAKSTLAIVGESGCGKSTLAKLLMRIEPATAGSIELEGKPQGAFKAKEYFGKIQMIFQDPYGSLNPRKKAWKIISEPLRINAWKSPWGCRKKALELMNQVGLRPEYANRFPHMFSGGQRQRIGVARALVLEPKVIVCDEPVSGLDVSVQAQVLNLLLDLQEKYNLSYVFISHDLSVVRHIADDVMVIYLGKVVEKADRDSLFSQPLHPYTQALLASTPQVHGKKIGEDGEKSLARGELPSPLNPPSGCAFHKRCPLAEERCKKERPILRRVRKTQEVACHLVDTVEVSEG